MKSSENLRLSAQLRRVLRECYRVSCLLAESPSLIFFCNRRLRTSRTTNPVIVTPHTNATNIKKMAFFSSDNLYLLSQGAVVLFGGLALLSGKLVNDRQSSELLKLGKELADARTKQADAEAKLEQLRLGQTPRLMRLLKSSFADFLKTKPTGIATIWTVSEDEEARILASYLAASLSSAGWRVSGPVDIPDIPKAGSNELTLFQRATGGLSGPTNVVLRYSEQPVAMDGSTPTGALFQALEAANLLTGGNPDPDRAKDDVLIVIGKKQ